MEKIKNAGARVGLVTGVVGMLVMGGLVTATGANAVDGDPVMQGYTDAGTKVALYGGGAVVLVLAGLVIWLGIKYLSKGIRHA